MKHRPASFTWHLRSTVLPAHREGKKRKKTFAQTKNVIFFPLNKLKIKNKSRKEDLVAMVAQGMVVAVMKEVE